MNANEMYAVAAATQRTPGFSFSREGDRFFAQRIEFASIISRLVAAFIDGILSGVAILLLVLGMAIVDTATGGDPHVNRAEAVSNGTFLIIGIAISIFLWFYYVAQETSAAQATLGKRFVGIKVTTPTGEPIGVGRSTVRFLVKMVPGGYPLLGFISVIADIACLAVNPFEKRTAHDRVAGTIVIKA